MNVDPKEFARVYRDSLNDHAAASMFDRAMGLGPCDEFGCTKNEYGCSGVGCLLNFADKDASIIGQQ